MRPGQESRHHELRGPAKECCSNGVHQRIPVLRKAVGRSSGITTIEAAAVMAVSAAMTAETMRKLVPPGAAASHQNIGTMTSMRATRGAISTILRPRWSLSQPPMRPNTNVIAPPTNALVCASGKHHQHAQHDMTPVRLHQAADHFGCAALVAVLKRLRQTTANFQGHGYERNAEDEGDASAPGGKVLR